MACPQTPPVLSPPAPFLGALDIAMNFSYGVPSPQNTHTFGIGHLYTTENNSVNSHPV